MTADREARRVKRDRLYQQMLGENQIAAVISLINAKQGEEEAFKQASIELAHATSQEADSLHFFISWHYLIIKYYKIKMLCITITV